MVYIADLWVPAVWAQALHEPQATYSALFTSGVVARNPIHDALATGAGTTVNVPFFSDISDQADQIQVEATAPADNGQPGGVMVAPVFNRVTKNSVGAMAKQITGTDPLQQIITWLYTRRLKQRQATTLSILRGLFGSAGAVNGAACMAANRLGGTVNEPFSENGAAALSNQLFSPDLFIFAKALMGENENLLANGALWIHPNVLARLEQLDALNFKTLIKSSELPFTIRTYRDIPIFLSSNLVRAGTQSGFVYETYLLAPGVIAYGEKLQMGDVTDVASLQYWRNRDLNEELIWDYTRHVQHVLGTKWVGNPAGQSATNAELATPGNWQYLFQTTSRVPAVCIRTNG